VNTSHRYFVTGTGTGIGKTIISAILCKKFNCQYFKPIQSGSILGNDVDFIKRFNIKIIDSKYNFRAPFSPNIAAKKSNEKIDINEIKILENINLIVEGAGGVFVPINEEFLMIDLIKKLNLEVIVVTKSGLGMINHTLLTIFALQKYQISIKGIIVNGLICEDEIESILQFCDIKIIARVPYIDKNFDFSGIEINL